MRHVLAALWFAVAVVLLAPRSSAEERELQVIALGSPDAWQNAKALTGAMRRAVIRTEGLALAPGEFSLEVLTAALDCPEPPDDACLVKMNETIKADSYIWGTVKKAPNKEVEAHLRLWQKDGEDRETIFTFSQNLNDDTDDTLLGLAEGALGKLLGEASSTLVITAGKINGEVMVNGMLAGLVQDGHAELEVPAGKLTVVIEAKGYEKLRGSVEVKPGGRAKLELTPVAAKEDLADEGDETTGVTAAEADRPFGSKKLWGYAAVGLGAVSAGVGGVFWAQSYSQANDEEFKQYVDETPRDQDPCVRARSDPDAGNIREICDSNVTSRTMAFVLVPLGVVLGGVGAYLLVTDSDSENQAKAEGVRFEPRVGLGRGAGSLDLRMTF